MNRDRDLLWLERLAAGARDVLADYRGALMRGNCFPRSTEDEVEPYVPDITTPRDAQHLNLDFIRRTDCANCGATKPLKREWSGNRLLCEPCRESAEERACEHRSEEQYRKRFEHLSGAR